MKSKQFAASDMASLVITPIVNLGMRTWLRIKASHYDISAEVETGKAKQATDDASTFQKRAALARADIRMYQ